MSRRLLVVTAAFAIGIGVGGAVGLAAHGGAHLRITPRSDEMAASPIPAVKPIRPQTMLAWTYHPLLPGFATRVAYLPGVAHAVPVVSGLAWMTRSFSAGGALVDRPPPGYAIPLELAAADLNAYARLLSPADRAFLPELARGQAVLGATSARIRRISVDGVLQFGNVRLRVAGVVPDAEIGAHELFVSLRTAARLGLVQQRYLLIDLRRGASFDTVAASIRGLLPQGVPLRIRGPGETTYFRQADAVLPPVILKELFGEFAAKAGPGGTMQMDPRWEARHIADASVPILGHVRCNRGIIPQLRGGLGELQHNGLSHLINPSQYEGCYVPKFIFNDPRAGISAHAWGIAFDINVPENVFGHTPHQDPRLVQTLEKWGFLWGGRYLVPDGMHFEFVRFSSG